MPTVETAVEVAGVPIGRVWEVVRSFERYPETMADVLEVRWLEQDERRGRSSWRVLLNGSELTWVEEDTFAEPERIAFDQVEGDLEVFRGEWALEETGGGVRVTLRVEFDLGVPSLAPVMDPLGVRAIRANSRSMLAAIAGTTPGAAA